MSNSTSRRTTLGRKIGGAVAEVALAAAGIVALAAPASAAPGNCYSGQGCLYSGYDYGTDWGQNFQMLYFVNCIDNLTAHGYNDITSSAYNQGNWDGIYLYPDSVMRGFPIYISLSSRGVPNMNTRGFNDVASSAYFESTRSHRNPTLCG